MNPLPKHDNIYYLTFEDESRNTAGYKAPADIAELCRREGFRPLRMPLFRGKEATIQQKLWLLTAANAAWTRNARKLPERAVVIYQHPFYGMRLTRQYMRRLQKTKHCRFVAVIHDLESLRRGIQGVKSENRRTNSIGDNEFLKEFDAVICHNEHMRQYLISKGFDPQRLVSLELFDYLTDAGYALPVENNETSVAIAGYLAPGKCSYLYRIHDNGNNAHLKVHLFGNAFEPKDASSGLIYHGSFPPEEISEHLRGKFGLVWDGMSAETCAGNTGEYLKYNNPHKTSLYLAAGLPVVVWSKAAVADFVLSNGVGITVDSLENLEEATACVTDEDYRRMCENASAISGKLRSGYFFLRALHRAFEIIQPE